MLRLDALRVCSRGDKHPVNNLGLMLDEEDDYDLFLSKADEFWEQAGEENRL